MLLSTTPFLLMKFMQLTTLVGSGSMFMCLRIGNVPILFTLEKVTIGATPTHLTQMLLCVMLSFGGVNEEVVGRKLVSFGTNGGFVFTYVCNGITT